MGVILAKFRKSKTTYELLENLENDIKGIEAYTLSTQERQKRIVGNFLLFSIGLYALGLIIFYFAFFPPTWSERAIYSIPLLTFPIIILMLKRLVGWYFQRKLNKNSNKLNTLKAEKKKIIERVMDKETYKIALDIITRFAEPSKTTTSALTPRMPYNTQSVTPIRGVPQQQKYNPTNTRFTTLNTAVTGQSQYQISPLQRSQMGGTVQSGITPTPIMPSSGRNILQHRQQQQPVSIQQQQRTPFPVINPNDKSILEKMVDFLIGDGPSSRFAMICKECHGHNGMASFEDYQYTAFNCVYCKTFNAARKLRPVGPKLPNDISVANIGNEIESQLLQTSSIIARSSDSSTSSSERESGSDSESSNTQKPEEKNTASLPSTTTDKLHSMEPQQNINDIENENDHNQPEEINENVDTEIKSEILEKEEVVEQQPQKPVIEKKND